MATCADVYIDRQSFWQVAEEGERPTPRGLVLIETRLADHRMVSGLLVPFVLEIRAGTDERQRLSFETVEVNVGPGRRAVRRPSRGPEAPGPGPVRPPSNADRPPRVPGRSARPAGDESDGGLDRPGLGEGPRCEHRGLRLGLGEDADLPAGVPEEDVSSAPNSPARTPARRRASALAV